MIKNNLIMKKFLILFVMLFVFTCVSYAGVGDVLVNSGDTLYHDGKAMVDSVYHDGKAVVSTVYQDAKSGAASIYPDVKSAVVSIGKAIGVAAEHVYGVLVKKYFVLGVKEACILLAGIITFFMGMFYWRRYTKNGQPITYGLILPIILLCVGLGTIFSVDYDAMLMGIINPEYGAINYILEYTKGIVSGN
jgi:hypothetical protein